MATKVQAKSAELYEASFYVWAEEQAALLRARRFDALDLGHLIEEVEGLADTKLSAVLNVGRVVTEELLNLQFGPVSSTTSSGGRRTVVGEREAVTGHRARADRLSDMCGAKRVLPPPAMFFDSWC